MLIKKKLSKVVKQFCLETSIHGLPHIARGLKEFFWITATFLATLLCVWQSVLNVGEYLTYHVQTKSTTDVLNSIEFPAITICSQYNIKRSTLSRVPLSSLFLATANANDDRNIQKLIKQNEISCKTNENVETVNMIDLLLEKRLIDQGMEDGSLALNNKYFVGFQDSALECYWKDKLFPCNYAFINFVNDFGACFMFNPGYEMALTFKKTATGKDMNISAYQNISFQVDTPNTGLRLLIRTNQDEYCGNDEIKRGAGISFKIHDKNVIHYTSHGDYFYLSPGYHNRIILRKVIHNRKTEHLKQCASHMKLYISPQSDRYIQDMCLVQCSLEIGLQKCKCLVPHFRMYKEYFMNHTADIGMNVKDIKLCRSLDELKCLKQVHRNYTEFNLKNFARCSHCIQPCYKETYDLQISRTLLTRSVVSNYQSLNKSDILRNFMVVSFEFGSLSVETIEESQAFTIQDLFTYLGGNIGLFLGMSCVSCVEIFYLFIYLIHNCFRGVENLKSNNRKKFKKINRRRRRSSIIMNKFHLQQKRRKSKIRNIKVAPMPMYPRKSSRIVTTSV